MLRAYALDYTASWDHNLPQVEFVYNNSYHTSIGVGSFKALCGQRCRIPICWDEATERKPCKIELIDQTNDVVKIIRRRLQAAQNR